MEEMTIIKVLVGIIVLVGLGILGLRHHMVKYYEDKLKDMNNCYGVKCPECDKYKKTCEGRDQWYVGSTKTKE